MSSIFLCIESKCWQSVCLGSVHALNEIALAAVFDGHGGHSAADYMSKNLYKLLSVSIEDEKNDGECKLGKLLSYQMQGAPFGPLSLSFLLTFNYVHDFSHTMVH